MLDELAKTMPVIRREEQYSFVGGGSGIANDPYTVAEFESMCAYGTWNGGYVEGWGYTYPEITCTGGYGSNGNYGNSVIFNVESAINHLTNNAMQTSSGYCARHVRQALEAGGLSTGNRPGSACDYDTYLTTIGFGIVNSYNYIPQVGDIVVHEATDGHSHGHIAMYNGVCWISDFVQSDMYGGSAYRNNPNYTILRWNP